MKYYNWTMRVTVNKFCNLENTISQPRAKHGNLLGQCSPRIFGAIVRAWFIKNHSFLSISVDVLYALITILLKVSFISPTESFC